MLHFLSAEALYGLLLVTTFASVGLLGLWAASSRWHPFLRTAIVLAILSVLLLRPMFEPFVMLVSQVATIAAGVAVYRWFKNRKQANAVDAKPTRYQYSLKTLLFVSTLVAMGAAVVAKAPELGWLSWTGHIAAGVLAGFATLCIACTGVTRNPWLLLTGILGGIAFTGIAVALPMHAYEMATDPNHVRSGPEDKWIFGFVAASTIAQLVIVILWLVGIRGERPNFLPFKSVASRTISCALLLSLAALPGYVAWRLINPLPRPPVNGMKPNAYKDLMALANKLDRSPLITAFQAVSIDQKRLAQEIANHSTELIQLDKLLERPSVVPDPMNDDHSELIVRRALAYALYAQSEVARSVKDIDKALEADLKALWLSEKFKGGNLSDCLMSFAIENGSIEGIYQIVSDCDVRQCELAINTCLNHEKNREPNGTAIQRFRRYDENYDDWWGHLHVLISELIGEERYLAPYYNQVLHYTSTNQRLLILELALRKYQLTHNSLPDNLGQLVPNILPEVPRDPFDPAGGPLRYKRTDDGYILYSVSQNGVDDGGIPPDEEGTVPADWFDWWQSEHGDLRLDHHFAEP